MPTIDQAASLGAVQAFRYRRWESCEMGRGSAAGGWPVIEMDTTTPVEFGPLIARIRAAATGSGSGSGSS
jgi:hypothetical protein